MTEQQMPARIWVGSGYDLRFWQKCKPDDLADSVCQTAFIRADIAERMAEALGDLVKAINYRDACSVSQTSAPRLADAAIRLQSEIEEAQAALSAFRSATQDTEARHD